MDFGIIRNLALIASYKLSLEYYPFWGYKFRSLSVYLYINNYDTIRISDHISSSNEVFTHNYIVDNGKIYYSNNKGIYNEISRTEFLKNIYKIKPTNHARTIQMLP